MNPSDQQAEAVWKRTLPQIRSTRRRRRNRRIAGAGAAGCAFAIWFTLQGPDAPQKSTAHIEPASPKIETIAVMKVDENGTIRLEEITSDELGSFQFAFGQTPLLPSKMAISEIFPEDSPWF